MTLPQPGAPNDPVIVVDHVVKRFEDFTAVDGVDFSIGAGEFFSILGPSGCGKTTTLRMIAGFEEPTSGRILLEGKDVSHVPPYRRNVNTVFQQYALFPHMTVYDNVAFGPRSMKVAPEEVHRRVMELLEVVHLAELTGRKPAQLSGGQQQRVALARALVNYPSALLLDEPLGALDLKLSQVMQVELKRIQREVGIAFVYVTHDQEEALTMSDRIAVMNRGKVEQIGTPTEIYEAPETVFVADFIGEMSLLPGRLTGAGVATIAGDHRMPVTATPRFRDGAEVTVMVRPERVRVAAAQPTRAPAIPVTIGSVVFQGAFIRVTARTAGGHEVIADADYDRPIDGLKAGDEAWMWWDDGAARALPPAPKPGADP